MSTEDADDRLTDAEVAELARKLGEWAEGLAPRERAFLLDVVMRAASASLDDVQGYMTNIFVQMESIEANRDKCGKKCGLIYPPESFSYRMSQLLPLLR